MKTTKALIVFFGLLGISSAANAFIFLEPYLGYEMQTMQATSKSGGSQDASGNAIDGGLKFGYHTAGGFWFGADALIGTGGKMKFDNSALKDADYSRTQVFADLGYNFPKIVSVWAGYAVMNEWTTKQEGSSEAKFTGGTAYKVGLGFRVLPHMMIGAEYRANSPADFEQGSSSGAIDKTYSTFNDNVTAITLNFPFMF